MRKAAFLDRDGVINRKAPDGGYITRWEDFQVLPGVPEAIARLRAANFLVIVVTNQRGIARGLMSAASVEEIHANMNHQLQSAGATLDAVYYCPHDVFPPCACRKPLPGMLLRAAAEHHLNLENSWMIGDTRTDIEAGKNAGSKTILIAPLPRAIEPRPDLFAESLQSAAILLSS